MSGMNMKIDKFTGTNSFSLWQIKMKALLKQQGLWAPLSGKKVEPITTEMEVTEEEAYSTILLCLADEIIIEIQQMLHLQRFARKIWTSCGI
uniref:DUF4219 domain-containing protein n=1 Tax=Brassica oleracea var. oleracea TaxID=109376 RepID=A0A0D3E7P4_BRAOL